MVTGLAQQPGPLPSPLSVQYIHVHVLNLWYSVHVHFATHY